MSHLLVSTTQSDIYVSQWNETDNISRSEMENNEAIAREEVNKKKEN